MPLNRRIVLDDAQIKKLEVCQFCASADCGGHHSSEHPEGVSLTHSQPNVAVIVESHSIQTQSSAMQVVHHSSAFAPVPKPIETKTPEEVRQMISAAIQQQRKPNHAKAATEQFDIFQDFVKMGQIGATGQLMCERCRSKKFTTDFEQRWIKCKECGTTRSFDNIFAEY